MLDRFVSPFTLFIGPVALGIAIALNQWVVVSILLLWFLVSRGVRIWFHLTRCPKDLLVLPVYIAVTYLTAAGKIYALFTLNKQGWITRWSEDRL
jgi:hyaluronan synthase